MRHTPAKHLIMVYQCSIAFTEQQYIHGNSGDLLLEGLAPHFSRNLPRRKPASQVSQFNRTRYRMFLSQVIYTILWSTLPVDTPLHRAPPQLNQIKMIANHMSCHIHYITVPQYEQHPVWVPRKRRLNSWCIFS